MLLFSVSSKDEAKSEDAKTRMPSETSGPGTASQEYDDFEKQWRVHIRPQNRCYPIHVLPAQRWGHLSHPETPDYQLSKGELRRSGYSVHWRGRRSKHRIMLQFSNDLIQLCCLKRELCTLFHTHILPFFPEPLWRIMLKNLYIFNIISNEWSFDGLYYSSGENAQLYGICYVVKDVFHHCTVIFF